MKKIIKLTESQMSKLTEVRINEVTAAEVAKVLETIRLRPQVPLSPLLLLSPLSLFHPSFHSVVAEMTTPAENGEPFGN